MTTNTVSPNKSARREAVQALVVHWSGGSFRSARDWCLRPESEVTYHLLLGRADDETELLCPWSYAAWACGAGRPPKGSPLAWKACNHATESIALSGGPPTPPTDSQVVRLTHHLAHRMRAHGWGPAEVDVRILDHRTTRAAAIAAGVKATTKPDVSGAAGWLDMGSLRANVALVLERGLDLGGPVAPIP